MACASRKRDDRLAALLAAYSTDAWVNLMIAEAGASAALTGLVFVAVSINLQKVLSYPSLPGRAGESIALLFSVLIVATFCLVPNQSTTTLGWELLVLGTGQWMALNAMHLRYLKSHREEPWHWMGTRIFFNQLASLPVAIAGISLLLGAGGGLYWLLPGILFSLIAGVFHAWVLLVEIMR